MWVWVCGWVCVWGEEVTYYRSTTHLPTRLCVITWQVMRYFHWFKANCPSDNAPWSTHAFTVLYRCNRASIDWVISSFLWQIFKTVELTRCITGTLQRCNYFDERDICNQSNISIKTRPWYFDLYFTVNSTCDKRQFPL